MRIETQCIQEGYQPQNSEPRVLPIYQSTTYKYDNCDTVSDLFDLKTDGHMYSRISNPTVAAVEKKIAALEGGVGAVCTTTGQAATFLAVVTILKAGDHIVSSNSVYGGTMNLFDITLRKFGIETTFVSFDDSEEVIQKAVRPNTKLFFTETISNPALTVADIEKIASLAHKNQVPLMVDNTFATPILCKPFDFGADIVTHSTSKYMDGHAVQLGGAIVDSGKFNWKNGKYPEMTIPDASYHGLIYTENFGEQAYITKVRVQMVRDLGCLQSANGAFLTNLGLETLALRVERHSSNALTVAKYLEANPKVNYVNYPGLESNKYHNLAIKYFPKGASGVISFDIKGGKKAAMTFMDSLKLAAIVVHVADARTGVLHPASTTHRQLKEEQLPAAGITPGLIRMSVGIENVEDILEDLAQAFDKI